MVVVHFFFVIYPAGFVEEPLVHRHLFYKAGDWCSPETGGGVHGQRGGSLGVRGGHPSQTHENQVQIPPETKGFFKETVGGMCDGEACTSVRIAGLNQGEHMLIDYIPTRSVAA